MTTRSDVHAESNLKPEDYSFVVALDLQPEIPMHTDELGNIVLAEPKAWEVWMPEFNGLGELIRTDGAGVVVRFSAHTFYHAQAILWANLLRSRSSSPWAGSSQCHHCGARIRYGAVLQHAPTNEYILVGETCLDNRFSATNEEFARMRKLSAAQRAFHRTLSAWDAFKLEHSEVDWEALHASSNSFIIDVLARGFNTGTLTARQLETIQAALVRDAEFAARKAERDAAHAAAIAAGEISPAPEGRVVVTGAVVSTKWVENDFGGGLKMLVLSDAGFKVWSTVPAALNEVEAGTKVQFTATLTPSNDDAYFAFAKRPSAAKVL